MNSDPEHRIAALEAQVRALAILLRATVNHVGRADHTLDNTSAQVNAAWVEIVGMTR